MPRLISVLVFILVAAIAPAVPTVEAVDLPTTPPVYKFPRELQKEYPLIQQDEIEKMIGTHDAKLLVINFWSTSCAPCLEELPFFQKAHEKYRDKGMRLVGYNTDYDLYGDEWEPVAHAAGNRLKLTFPQYGMDTDPNESIPFFSENWMGEQPATFFYFKGGKKAGEHLGEIEEEEFYRMIERYLAAAEKSGAAELAIEQRAKDAIARVLTLGVNEITAQLALEPAQAAQVARELEKEFDIAITPEAAAGIGTVGDAINLVKKQPMR